MDISGLAQAGFLPTAYFESEKEMDTVLAPTRIDANGNVDTRSVLERSQAAGINDTGTSYEGRVGESTYKMMASARVSFITGKMSFTAEKMVDKYDKTMSEINSEQPALADKDWDFTINANDEIEIITGKDDLNEAEIEYLQEKMDGFTDELSVIAQGIEGMYATMTEHPEQFKESWQYDVNRENVPDFFRGREFMNGRQKAQFGDGFDFNIGKILTTQLIERGADLKLDLPQHPNIKVDLKV